MSLSENVGVRLVVTNGAAYLKQMSAATDANLKFRDSLLDTADAARVSSDVTTEAMEKTGAATKAATDSQVENDAAIAASAKSRTKSVKDAADATTSHLKNALGALSTISKWGLAISGGVIYEGMQQYTAFNPLMTVVSTHAGIAAGRLPALSKGLMGISVDTGQSLNDVADALYRIASG